MTHPQLHLKQYFFTHQEVVARPEYNPTQPANHSFDQAMQIKIIDATEYGIQLTAKLNESLSENPSYFFNLEIFAIIESSEPLKEKEATAFIRNNVFSVLLGSIRERLAEITARGPWPNIVIDFVPITTHQPTTDKPEDNP